MTRTATALLAACCCAAPPTLSAQAPPPVAGHIVATVDVFGYSGWSGDDPDTAALRKRLSARVGQEIAPERASIFRRAVQGDAIAATGKPATDVAVVCCNENGGVAVFVGVQGKEAEPLEQRATPTGPDALPPEALSLYVDEEKASAAADARGVAQADETQGYALSRDPATRSLQEKMHAFAMGHEDVIVRVLRRSGAVQQRQAAAALLGYAQRSPVQIRALLAAVDDDDDRVRDHAAGALAVLATTGPLPGFSPEPFVGLLYSGIWTDRSKASSLLAVLTRSRDPKLLKVLRDEALPPLIEGARWQARAQAYPFGVLLARVEGMPEERAEELLHDGKVDGILQQAEALRAAGEKR